MLTEMEIKKLLAAIKEKAGVIEQFPLGFYLHATDAGINQERWIESFPFLNNLIALTLDRKVRLEEVKAKRPDRIILFVRGNY